MKTNHPVMVTGAELRELAELADQLERRPPSQPWGKWNGHDVYYARGWDNVSRIMVVSTT